jgi:hypothetical protein
MDRLQEMSLNDHRSEGIGCILQSLAATPLSTESRPRSIAGAKDEKIVLTVPFLGILASADLYFVITRLYASERPVLSLVVFALLFSLSRAKRLIEDRDDFRWRDFERMATKIDGVTPPDGMLLADEHVYFLTWRPPPSGMELADSHKLEFPPATAALFHLLPKSESDRRIKAGTYDTVETCEDDEEDVQALG